MPWPNTNRRRKIRRTTQHAKKVEHIEDNNKSESAETVTTTADTDATYTPRPETPSTTQPPSEHAPSEHGASELASTTPTTPSSAQPTSADMSRTITPTQTKVASRTIALPLIPAIPKGKSAMKSTPPATTPKQETAKEVKVEAAAKPAPAPASVAHKAVDTIAAIANNTTEDAIKAEKKDETPAPAAAAVAPVETAPLEEAKPASAPAPSKPSSWAALLHKPASVLPRATTQAPSPTEQAKSSLPKSSTEKLSDALKSFSAKTKDSKIAFLEPRGLVNTGNMCYMNSVLQVLVFCIPFYNFLDVVGANAKHSFKSETPLIDAM